MPSVIAILLAWAGIGAIGASTETAMTAPSSPEMRIKGTRQTQLRLIAQIWNGFRELRASGPASAGQISYFSGHAAKIERERMSRAKRRAERASTGEKLGTL
jgi:hypothetical protein